MPIFLTNPTVQNKKLEDSFLCADNCYTKAKGTSEFNKKSFCDVLKICKPCYFLLWTICDFAKKKKRKLQSSRRRKIFLNLFVWNICFGRCYDKWRHISCCHVLRFVPLYCRKLCFSFVLCKINKTLNKTIVPTTVISLYNEQHKLTLI